MCSTPILGNHRDKCKLFILDIPQRSPCVWKKIYNRQQQKEFEQFKQLEVLEVLVLLSHVDTFIFNIFSFT